MLYSNYLSTGICLIHITYCYFALYKIIDETICNHNYMNINGTKKESLICPYNI